MKQVYLNRLEKVYERMREEDVTCMFITPSPNMNYLTGYSHWADERLMTAVFSPGQKPFLVANRLCAAALSQIPYQDIYYWTDGMDPYALLEQQLAQRGISTCTVAVDDAAAAVILVPLLNRFQGSKIILASQVLSKMRMYKDEFEKAAMRTACQKASDALRITMEKGRGWIGHTEEELARALCTEMTRQGLDYGGACVSCREGSAEPHHVSSNRVIEDNSCMWIDFGSIYQNYNTDLTRAFYFGEPDPEYAELCRIVNEAREAGIAAAKVGIPLHQVDDAARSVICRYGYGQYFTHRTGHGIGLLNHEGPGPSAGEKTPIAPGMAFTVEPGIYIPGKYGVRVEDQLLVEEDGTIKRLHDYPTDLTVFRGTSENNRNSGYRGG